MLADTLIIVGLVTASVALLELFLSDEHKKLAANCTVQLWNRLDDLSRISLFDWLRNNRNQVGAAGLLSATVAVACTFLVLPPTSMDNIHDSIILLLISYFFVAVAGYMGLVAIRLSLRANSSTRILGRAVRYMLLSLLPIVPVILAAFIWPPSFGGYPGANAAAVYEILAGLLCLTVASVIFLVLVVPIAVLYLATCLLSFIEFLVRRIAEYAKGPIVAASLLLTAVGAILKALN